jgi:transcriptional regulator CtsR
MVFIIENLIKDILKEKAKEYREVNKDKINAKINWIESHVNVVVLQEEIKFPNIKNHHVPWTSGH